MVLVKNYKWFSSSDIVSTSSSKCAVLMATGRNDNQKNTLSLALR